jgi:probable HAF family extracellular repeat protein
MQGLGDLPGGTFFSDAASVSANGDVVTGFSASTASGTRSEAFRWSTTNGMTALGDPPGGNFNSRAWAVSADGTVIVGEGSSATSGSNLEGFRWSAGSFTGLGDLPGGIFHSIAYAASADGSVIVGYSIPPSGVHEAFRWTATNGMVGLGFLPCDTWSIARAVSGDGRIIVGDAQNVRGGCVFIWDAQRGTRDLREVLTIDYGLDLTGWRIDSARALSHDGSVIVGYGINPSGATEAWVADLRPPSLDVVRDGSALILSWPTNFADFQLETSPAIDAGAWQTLPAHRNAEKFIATNNATTHRRFFRLRKQ